MAQRDLPIDEKNRPNNPERPSAKPASSVPATDMQPEDAGTPASGADGRGTAAEPAMKQTSKTSDESGDR
jgi:hypothetical protein